MTTVNVVKIDLCKSKLFNSEKEITNPNIREIALSKLLESSKKMFPYADKAYPDGSFYKAEGDAVLFFIDKPTIAIRSSIEFMKDWYYQGIKQDELPECKVIIHQGRINEIEVPDNKDFIGKVFEDISVIEKKILEGKIFVSEQVKNTADDTITKFSFFKNIKIISQRKIDLYFLSFDDPRTFQDDALAHMLFIAHKESSQTRNNILKFFIIEYLIENKIYRNYDHFNNWCLSKGYPRTVKEDVKSFLNDENYFEENSDGTYILKEVQNKKFHDSQISYERSEKEAISVVSAEIEDEFKSEKSIELFDLKLIIEEYLCAIFSEIRMMANYFKNTDQFYESDPNLFKRYEYIIERNISELDENSSNRWKNAFLRGLQKLSKVESTYISTIFYNVLAGYFLNRVYHTPKYQLKKLQKRQIFIDTNIIYALRCQKNIFHEQVQYFMERLQKIGIKLKVFSFSIDEYEYNLSKVEYEYNKNPNSQYLITRTPGLYKEFITQPQKYMNDISVCRNIHSITKGKEIKDETYEEIEKELNKNNLILEKQCISIEDEEKDELRQQLRSIILSKAGVMEEYWDLAERLDAKSENVIDHDVNLIENINACYLSEEKDELGPKVILITADGKLIRCRRNYPFILSIEQFLEFMLPYLFLGDINTDETNKLPNQLLSARIGINASHWQPNQENVISMLIENPDLMQNIDYDSPNIKEISKILSGKRFEEVFQKTEILSKEEKEEIIKKISLAIDEKYQELSEESFTKIESKKLKNQLRKEQEEKEALLQELDELKKEKEKYRKRAKYLKQTISRKK
jgi:hypothetical protein